MRRSEEVGGHVGIGQATTSSQLSNVFNDRTRVGTRESRNTLPITKNVDRVSQYTGPVSVPATCHTSALMNRNVWNSSSSGSARTITLRNTVIWDVVRFAAQPSSGTTP